MTSTEIRFDAEAVAFLVGERRIEISLDGSVVLPLRAVEEASISSLEAALESYENRDAGMDDMVFLADVPSEQFDADTSPRQTGLKFLEGRLSALVVYHLPEDGPELDVEHLLAPLLERYGGEILGSYTDSNGLRSNEMHMVALADREKGLGELHALEAEAHALVRAAAGTGSLTAASTRDLLAAGLPGAILGQPEASWIDAKAVPHRTDSEAAKFELAKDVAAFANTGEDAVIVYGIATGAGTGGDVLETSRPFDLTTLDVPALRSALNDRLTPLLTDIEIEAVEIRAGHGFGWILIPAQPSWIRPVLVRGALIGDRVGGSFFSLPFRIGEDTRHWDPSTVHSLIQAGRVALQGEPTDEGGSESSSS